MMLCSVGTVLKATGCPLCLSVQGEEAETTQERTNFQRQQSNQLLASSRLTFTEGHLFPHL